eukprot:2144258-Amphidinium_carterae.4
MMTSSTAAASTATETMEERMARLKPSRPTPQNAQELAKDLKNEVENLKKAQDLRQQGDTIPQTPTKPT